MILVDVNLLLYAVNRDSPQHAAAKAWFENVMSGSTAIGLPWVVLLAFLRLTRAKPACVLSPPQEAGILTLT